MQGKWGEKVCIMKGKFTLCKELGEKLHFERYFCNLRCLRPVCVRFQSENLIDDALRVVLDRVHDLLDRVPHFIPVVAGIVTVFDSVIRCHR